jgi:hypothetical protein
VRHMPPPMLEYTVRSRWPRGPPNALFTAQVDDRRAAVDILALIAALLARGTPHHVRAYISSDPQSQLSHSGARAAGAVPWLLDALDYTAERGAAHGSGNVT